jgi:hypothetical protein
MAAITLVRKEGGLRRFRVGRRDWVTPAAGQDITQPWKPQTSISKLHITIPAYALETTEPSLHGKSPVLRLACSP